VSGTTSHTFNGVAHRHGFGAASGSVMQDLRRSLLLTSKTSWDEVVLVGALTDRAYVGEMRRTLPQQESPNHHRIRRANHGASRRALVAALLRHLHELPLIVTLCTQALEDATVGVIRQRART
jgi:hypothetical protein